MLKMSVHTWKRIVELRLTEEEVNLLRLYINQHGYVDLHWILAFIRQKLVYKELQEKNL